MLLERIQNGVNRAMLVLASFSGRTIVVNVDGACVLHVHLLGKKRNWPIMHDHSESVRAVLEDSFHDTNSAKRRLRIRTVGSLSFLGPDVFVCTASLCIGRS